MRILYYNWVDYLDDEKRGGGVSVYQRNLMAALDAQPEMEPVFVSSGLSHDLLNRAPRWEQIRHGPETDRARRYEIVNSGVLAPSHHSFGNAAQVSHAATRDVFFDFVEKTGPYDVIHFNNLEGLPVDVLALKTRWPQTRVVLALHNYYPICPQVNLWFQERQACTDFAQGEKCALCLPYKPGENSVRLANAVAYHLKCAGIRPGSRAFDLTFTKILRLGVWAARKAAGLRRRIAPRPEIPQSPAVRPDLAQRRAEMIACINAHCDRVLCVSDRVRVIAASYGIRPELLRTSYIGTREAEYYTSTSPAPVTEGPKQSLTLGFLGYMRRDKGFFFLLDALEALPADLAARLRVVVAARRGDGEVMNRIEALRLRLPGLVHIDGYSHDTLDEVLKDVDVGVIPVLWEDNLPQVAIEMHARHIPLLTSDMGGAQELANSPDMVFAAGDVQAFADRIRALLEGEIDFDAYWKRAQVPQTMAPHLEELKQIYADETEPELVSAIA